MGGAAYIPLGAHTPFTTTVTIALLFVFDNSGYAYPACAVN